MPDQYLDDSLDLPIIGSQTTLCERCQNFDIQTFAKTATRKRGYLLSNVETAAREGCEFCSLLMDSVKDVEKPGYFYANMFRGRTTIHPGLYVHMTLSENYADKTLSSSTSSSPRLQANRLLAQLGDRFSEVRNASEHELCLAADPS